MLSWAGWAGSAGLRNRLGWAWFGCAFEITARLCFGCARRFRCDFWWKVAPTWMPGPALIAIPLECGIEMHKSHISEKTVKNGACGAQVEAQIVQKLVKGVPSSPHRASKCSQMESWAIKLVYFQTSWTTLTHYPSRLFPACSFHFKTTLPDCLNRPAELLLL